ncbi:MAG: sigma 54-interacting transcriptional regulator [Pseudomonadota bacterium]
MPTRKPAAGAPDPSVTQITAAELAALPAPLAQKVLMYQLILDHIHNGVLVVDAGGFVTHFNEPYGRFLGVDPNAQVGRHALEVVENSRMHIVAQTGRPEINYTHRIKGQDMVVQRIPIYQNGRVIAVFGQVMFKDVRDVSRLARKLSLLESKVKFYENELISLRATRYTMDSIVGVSAALRDLKNEALMAAANQAPVLISGESGTGKELFAQAIHDAGPRRLHPFIRLNCAAIPRDLFEAELFGYSRGAFTGARNEGKPGKFELAHEGTIFLDEIGELPLEMQPKLLRVLEEKEFERVGGTKPLKSDFRLIAATNQNLEQMVGEGRFRKDLYYRLNVIPLAIPPLRERTEDIMPLARHLLAQMDQSGSEEAYLLTPEAQEVLTGHAWPGNVRELSNVLERVLSGGSGRVIRLEDLPFYLRRAPKSRPGPGHWRLKEVVARAESEALRHALAETDGNKAAAAALLGIHRTLLYKKLKRHGLEAAGGEEDV